MRFLVLALWLALCVIPFCSILGSQNSQSPGSAVLMNKDVLLMLKAGLTPEIVIAKIKSSDCNFDTDPVTLAGLKQASVPDSVILAMIQAHKNEGNKADGDTVFVNCVSSETKRQIHSTNFFGSSTVAEVGCGDALTSLGKGGGYYIKVRTKQGVVGYIMEDDVSKTQPQISRAQPPSAEPAFPEL
jgi:hypothetical protein